MSAGVLASILVPLVLIVVLFVRPLASRLGRAIRLALSALLLVSIPVQLVTLHDMRIEMRGTGYTPMFSFDSDEERFARLEAHRSRQNHATSDVALPEPAPELEDAATDLREPRADDAAPSPIEPEGSPLKSSVWNRFRGPGWDGAYASADLHLDWKSRPPREMWRQPIGGGYASFVFGTIGNDLWAFTIEQRRDREAVVAYDVMSGEERWVHSWPADFREGMGGNGPRATPTFDEGRLYALGALGMLTSLDASEGTVLWSVDLLEDNAARNLQWAFAWSPLIVDDVVITLPGGGDGRSVVAYHKLTGERVWSALSDTQAYTTPMLVTLQGQRQILTVSGERIMGLATDDGTLLWEWPWVTQAGVNASQPLLVSDDSGGGGSERVFLSAGYGHGAMMLQIDREADRLEPSLVWENSNMKNKFTSSVLHEGFIYGLDERILACIDAENGKRQWKGGRYGHGQLLLAGGHLIITTETGELVLVRATPEGHEEVARLPAVSGKTWNYPAMSEGILLVRNATEMVAFDLNRS